MGGIIGGAGSVVGHWSLVIGQWSLVIGHWSLVRWDRRPKSQYPTVETTAPFPCAMMPGDWRKREMTAAAYGSPIQSIRTLIG